MSLENYSLVELGVRTDDWRDVCKEILPKELYDQVVTVLRQRAANRNRAENKRLTGLYL